MSHSFHTRALSLPGGCCVCIAQVQDTLAWCLLLHMAKRGRKAPAPKDGAASNPSRIDQNHMQYLVELLVKAEARRSIVTTQGMGIHDITSGLDAALSAEAPVDDEGEDAPEGRRRRRGRGEEEVEEEAQAGAMSSSCGAMSSTSVSEEMRVKLDEIHEAAERGGRHSYNYAGNPSSVCGVCSSQWYPKCGWKPGKGNWACFTCQVYICKFECLNRHNKEGIGNTVRGKSIIHSQEECPKKPKKAKQ